MEVREIKNKELLNKFIVLVDPGNFLQSWEWGEFQEFLGNKIWRLGIFEKDELLGSVLLIKKILPFGFSYFYSSRVILKSEGVFNVLLDNIKKMASAGKAIFWRFDWVEKELPKYLAGEVKKARYDVQPKCTLILDLEKSEDDILVQMKPKTRYNIRLAMKKGVKIVISEERKDLEEFLHLNRITAERDGFRSHNDEYYRKFFDFWVKKGKLKIFLAKINNEILAANLVLFFGRRVTYLHGASSNQQRNLMAPYLLQWRQILEAKKMGYKEYDFWGIASTDLKDGKGKDWAGITRFKQGFGGKEVNYAGTYDLVLNRFWYGVYSFVKRLI